MTQILFIFFLALLLHQRKQRLQETCVFLLFPFLAQTFERLQADMVSSRLVLEDSLKCVFGSRASTILSVFTGTRELLKCLDLVPFLICRVFSMQTSKDSYKSISQAQVSL